MSRLLLAVAAALAVSSPSIASNFPAARFIQAKLDGKWGLLDQSGKTVLPFIYDDISVDENGDISLEINKQYGKADSLAHIFIPISHGFMFDFKADGHAVVVGEHWGLIDRQNRSALPEVFSSIDRFDNDDLYVANYKGKTGVLSLKDKKWVIPPSFVYIGSLAKNGLAVAKTDQNHEGFINRQGAWVISVGIFDEVQGFGDDGLAAAKTGSKWGFITAAGKWVIQPISEEFHWGDHFNGKGTIFVMINGKYRLMNRAGKLLESQPYDDARSFWDGLAEVKIGGKWGLVDEDGKVVLSPRFEGFTRFHHEGLAAAFEGKKSWIIDRKGNRQFGTKFDRVGGFLGGGWAPAAVGKKWGAIDVHGNWLIAPKYDCVSGCFDDPPPTITLHTSTSD